MVPKSGNPTWKPKKFKNEVHYKELAKHTKYIVENIIPITDDNPCRCEICRIGRKKLFSLKVSHYLGGEKAKFRITRNSVLIPSLLILSKCWWFQSKPRRGRHWLTIIWNAASNNLQYPHFILHLDLTNMLKEIESSKDPAT